MIDFEVIFTDWIADRTVRSKVYSVWNGSFLIADKGGHFKWVPVEDCKLPNDHADDYYNDYDEEPTVTAWDSYERWVEESQKDY